MQLAYVGPGAGFAFLGSFLTLIAGFFLSVFSLLLWPFVPDITTAFTTAGPALWEIGSSHVSGAPEHAIRLPRSTHASWR